MNDMIVEDSLQMDEENYGHIAEEEMAVEMDMNDIVSNTIILRH